MRKSRRSKTIAGYRRRAARRSGRAKIAVMQNEMKAQDARVKALEFRGEYTDKSANEFKAQRMIAQLLARNISWLRATGHAFYSGQAQGLASALLAIDAVDATTYCRICDGILAIALKSVK